MVQVAAPAPVMSWKSMTFVQTRAAAVMVRGVPMVLDRMSKRFTLLFALIVSVPVTMMLPPWCQTEDFVAELPRVRFA